jgi:hypothetical protein
MKTSDFNLEYFKFIREEILKRLDLHYKLVLSKFAFAGILFAFLSKTPPSTALSAFALASIFCFLFDVVILENLGWIRSAGAFVRQNIEQVDLPTVRVLKWETHFAQRSGPWRCFSWLGYVLGVWIIGPSFYVGFILSDFHWEIMDILQSALCLYLLVYSGWWLGKKNLAKDVVPMESAKSDSPLTSD